jgi:hypothetical protein
LDGRSCKQLKVDKTMRRYNVDRCNLLKLEMKLASFKLDFPKSM